MNQNPNTIDFTLILAFIGALAWLPQIITWIYQWIVKPKLRFVPEDFTEIGYSSCGPIINQFFAISTSGKDALIEKIEMQIIHQSGEKHNFIWKFLDERGPELTSMSGERVEWRKNQSAIALKVSTVNLVEKKIGFHDIDYQNNFMMHIKSLQDKLLSIERTNSDPNIRISEAIKTKELLDTCDFIKSNFYWKEGKYNVNLIVTEMSLKKLHREYFEFQLNKIDIMLLERNIGETQEFVKDINIYKGINRQQKIWNWINPTFRRKVNQK